MLISWRQQFKFNPSLKDLNNWPQIDLEMISENKRKTFIRNRNIAAYVLKGHSIKDSAKRYNISSSTVSYIMKRCLESHVNCSPALTIALIPNSCIKQNARKSELSEYDDGVGARGSFKYILESVDGLKVYLDKFLLNHINKVPYGENITPKFFHKYFLEYLRKFNWPEYRYPFNTTSLASETLRKYYYTRMRELKTSKLKILDFPVTLPVDIAPLHEIEIDAQMMDVESSMFFSFRGHDIALRVSRVTLYLVRDKASGSKLAYHISFTKHPNRYDLHMLFTKIHKKWEPLDLKTPGLKYSPGACLPSALDDAFQSIGFGIVRFDNALAHWAHLVEDFLTQNLKVTMNWGHPGSPKERNVIEHAFALLNEYIHRLNSTTGSHVKDPKKESRKNRKKVPVLTIAALEEIVSVLITAENVTPKKYLGSLTPNEFLMNSLKTSPLWLNFNCSYSNKNQFVTSEKVFVRCNEKNNESPHVNFLTLKYRGPGIVRPEFINKQIIAKYDYRDVREIEVTTLKGEPLGKLRAAKSWQLCPLSTTTLNNINKLIKKKRLSMKDPLSGYLEHLLENKHLPSQALELYRLFDQVKIAGEVSNSQDEISIVAEQNTAVTAEDTDKESDDDTDIPEWTPKLIFKDE